MYTAALQRKLSRCSIDDDPGYGSQTDLSGRSQSRTSLACPTTSNSDVAASHVLKKYEDKFMAVVDASLHLYPLKRKKVISERIFNEIERAKDSSDAKEILYNHLYHNADMASLREYCKVLMEASAYPKMQKLGEDMCNDLLPEDAAFKWKLSKKKWATIHCGDCDEKVAHVSDAFSMPGHCMNTETFVNPYGYTHTTVTVSRLRFCTDEDYKLVGEPTTEHTWFDGYAWTIIRCAHCGDHLGWKFTATTTGSDPQEFFGCTLKSCRLS